MLVAHASVMRRMTTGGIALLLALAAGTADAQSPKLDRPLVARAARLTGRSPVIIRPLHPLVDLLVQSVGGTLGRALPSVNGRVASVPNVALAALAANALVQKLALDRQTIGLNERTGVTVGATAVRNALGYDGNGVGVAIIDSGVAASHDDLTDPATGSRVVQFVDFVNGRTVPYDDYGHGTHVAGIVAGNGSDSSGARTGIAPRARLVVLKALNGSGTGRISDVIAALDYAVSHKAQFNIRVVNLSVAAGVYESYNSDLLAQATRQAVERGIVVVAAAGNNGHNANGQTQYGGVTAPGNAPWVLTIGASSHMGTTDRADDVMATFSSRGPTRFDYAAKPDLVAPGVGIESLSAPGSTLYSNYSAYLLSGTAATSYPPYLSLSGTSMASPVVAGTVALMLQANPSLTPNAVKAILQYTAQLYDGYDALTEGAGFLNAAGAVQLARFFGQGGAYPNDATWSRQIIWANHRVGGGRLSPDVNAWALTMRWGSDGAGGAPIVWGNAWNAAGNSWAAWGTSCSDPSCTSASWSGDSPNVVWGSHCGGADCSGTTWSTSDDDQTVVWGTDDDATVVWGTDDDSTVVWGTDDDETVVWGTSCGQDCQPIIWNR
jgi:serine protease AprX